ncbi:hypothetical protein ACFVKC_10830 [Streptomyces noursei]|uniref:hypothetical protein n=1 Tax=Streptomyces noursei TaxID=1971 RepID=UPI003624B8D2
MPRNPKKPRRLVADGRVYLRTLRHSHRVLFAVDLVRGTPRRPGGFVGLLRARVVLDVAASGCRRGRPPTVGFGERVGGDEQLGVLTDRLGSHGAEHRGSAQVEAVFFGLAQAAVGLGVRGRVEGQEPSGPMTGMTFWTSSQSQVGC